MNSQKVHNRTLIAGNEFIFPWFWASAQAIGLDNRNDLKEYKLTGLGAGLDSTGAAAESSSKREASLLK